LAVELVAFDVVVLRFLLSVLMLVLLLEKPMHGRWLQNRWLPMLEKPLMEAAADI
jgi:hypothetical protein